MQKLPNGCLRPNDDEAIESLRKLKIGQDVKVKVTRERNYAFHKKYFALLNLAFDFWEPAELTDDPEKRWMKNVTPQKNFDQFRKDITILAGYYEAYHRLNGEVRIEAKSIAFANMSEDEFEQLYSATINVILRHVLTHMTDEQLRNSVAEMVLEFA